MRFPGFRSGNNIAGTRGNPVKPGVLTIYKNHPVGNFKHKHKTIKCKVAGVGITIKYIHIS